MMVTGSIAVHLTDRQLSEMIVKALTEQYYHIAASVEELRANKNRKPFEEEDYLNDLAFLRAMDGVLGYYMTVEHHDNWCRTNKKFMDLYNKELKQCSCS